MCICWMGQGDEEKAGEPAYYGYCTVAAERMRPGLSQQPGCLGIIGLGSLGICGFITALVGIFMWPSQVSPFMDANALQDEMDHALDFAVVAGGCEIVSSGHSFVYHRDKNAPQYERGFCWDQYTFKIRSADQAASSIVGEYMVETEDVRRTTPQSPEEGACEGTPQAPSTRLAAAGATGVTGHYPRSVPCWVATSSSAVKRGQLSGEEGRGWLDQAVGGYRCGNSICLKLADPATEYAQLAPDRFAFWLPAVMLWGGLGIICFCTCPMLMGEKQAKAIVEQNLAAIEARRSIPDPQAPLTTTSSAMLMTVPGWSQHM